MKTIHTELCCCEDCQPEMWMEAIEWDRKCEQAIREANARQLSLGKIVDLDECCGLAYPGSSLNDYKDQVPCANYAIVALISGEYQGLVLCSKCYQKYQASAETSLEPEPPAR